MFSLPRRCRLLAPLLAVAGGAGLLALAMPGLADEAGRDDEASRSSAIALAAAIASREEPVNVLLLTVDTLRADRLSAYGYERRISPAIDALMARGVRFTEARTVEPLTNPALTSTLTSLYPHEHGATRNGLRMRPDLVSLPKILDQAGYQTAAFVANWTLKDKLSGLAEHFQDYNEVLTRKRWLGLVSGEATAEDVNEEALDWLAEHGGRRRPVFAWVHYVEPHAPYDFHAEYGERLGLSGGGEPSKADRYDTEIAFVDAAIGEVLDWVQSSERLAGRTLIVLASDHGESLGEHGYWGHGRNLYDPSLRVPLSITWPGQIDRGVESAPATLLDVAPTVLGLLGVTPPQGMRGHDWSGTLLRGEPAPHDRRTFYQAHKGAVQKVQDALRARRAGLLEVGTLQGGLKEVVRIQNGDEHRLHDLAADPAEKHDLGSDAATSSELAEWLTTVTHGLETLPDLPPVDIDEESVEKLRSLGYTG